MYKWQDTQQLDLPSNEFNSCESWDETPFTICTHFMHIHPQKTRFSLTCRTCLACFVCTLLSAVSPSSEEEFPILHMLFTRDRSCDCVAICQTMRWAPETLCVNVNSYICTSHSHRTRHLVFSWLLVDHRASSCLVLSVFLQTSLSSLFYSAQMCEVYVSLSKCIRVLCLIRCPRWSSFSFYLCDDCDRWGLASCMFGFRFCRSTNALEPRCLGRISSVTRPRDSIFLCFGTATSRWSASITLTFSGSVSLINNLGVYQGK